MNTLGLSILLVLLAVTLAGPRGAAALAMMAGVLYLTQSQEVVVGGAHLSAMRLLTLAALARIGLRGERLRELQRIDRLLLLLYAFTTGVFLMRSSVDRAYVSGLGLDAVMSYFVFRCLIQDAEALRALLRGLVPLLVPFVLLLGIEAFSGQNPFSVIGGLAFAERGGRLRAMGSFRHPSLLGTVGAAFLPLYMALWLDARLRARAGLGLLLCLAIILAANSGGPASAAFVAALAWLLWPARHQMPLVRRSLAGTLLLLALVMKAPIWYLPAKASALSGGDGWHRSYLMEVAFHDIGKWWLAGMDLDETREWFDYVVAATGQADITNQYLYFGLTAGLAAMLLFIWLQVRAYQGAGLALKAAATPQDACLAWGLGACIAVHAATWLGITYNFDQTYMIWSLQLAAVTSLSSSAAPVASPVPSRPPVAVTEQPW